VDHVDQAVLVADAGGRRQAVRAGVGDGLDDPFDGPVGHAVRADEAAVHETGEDGDELPYGDVGVVAVEHVECGVVAAHTLDAFGQLGFDAVGQALRGVRALGQHPDVLLDAARPGPGAEGAFAAAGAVGTAVEPGGVEDAAAALPVGVIDGEAALVLAEGGGAEE
jgi:hypothetical protein